MPPKLQVRERSNQFVNYDKLAKRDAECPQVSSMNQKCHGPRQMVTYNEQDDATTFPFQTYMCLSHHGGPFMSGTPTRTDSFLPH